MSVWTLNRLAASLRHKVSLRAASALEDGGVEDDAVGGEVDALSVGDVLGGSAGERDWDAATDPVELIALNTGETVSVGRVEGGA